MNGRVGSAVFQSPAQLGVGRVLRSSPPLQCFLFVPELTLPKTPLDRACTRTSSILRGSSRPMFAFLAGTGALF